MAYLCEQCLLFVAGEQVVLSKMLESFVAAAVLLQRRAIRLPIHVGRRVSHGRRPRKVLDRSHLDGPLAVVHRIVDSPAQQTHG